MPMDFGSRKTKQVIDGGNWGSSVLMSPELIEGCHSTKLILVLDFSFHG